MARDLASARATLHTVAALLTTAYASLPASPDAASAVVPPLDATASEWRGGGALELEVATTAQGAAAAIRAAVGAEGAARAAGWFDGSGPRDQAEGARAALMALSVRVRARAQSADLAAPAKLAGEDLAAVEGAESRFVDAQRREGERAEWAETFERARKWILENPWIEGFPTALKWAILAVAIGVPLLVAAYVWRTFR